jgi:hypothetical protein
MVEKIEKLTDMHFNWTEKVKNQLNGVLENIQEIEKLQLIRSNTINEITEIAHNMSISSYFANTDKCSIDFVISIHDDYYTLFLNLKILKFYKTIYPNVIKNIYVVGSEYEPESDLMQKIKDLKIVKKFTFIKNVSAASIHPIMCHWSYAELDHKDRSQYVYLISSDLFILNIEKFLTHCKKMIEDGFNAMGYYCNYGTGEPLLKADRYFDIFAKSSRYENLLNERVSLSALETIYNTYFLNERPILDGPYSDLPLSCNLDHYFLFNKSNWWHQYGYNSIIGRAHLHKKESKLYYLKLWEERYNFHLNIDEDTLIKEDKNDRTHECVPTQDIESFKFDQL